MSTINDQNMVNAGMEKDTNGIGSHDHASGQAAKQRKPYDYGGNPLAHINTSDSIRLPAFGGEFQPGSYKSIKDRKIANPAPLGLSAFALTTFVLSLINLNTRGVAAPNIVVGAAFAYGGLCQLLAGMWYVEIQAMQLVDGLLILRPGKWPLETPLVPPLFHHTVVSGLEQPSS